MIEVQIKYFNDTYDEHGIGLMENKSDWFDLRAAEDVSMKKGEFKLIPLGIGLKMPENYEAWIVPRSSTFAHYHILQVNNMGVIDNSYCGDEDQWMFPALAMEDTEIHKGDRICQFRIHKNQDEVLFKTVDHLDEENRGGFGSTGVD